MGGAVKDVPGASQPRCDKGKRMPTKQHGDGLGACRREADVLLSSGTAADAVAVVAVACAAGRGVAACDTLCAPTLDQRSHRPGTAQPTCKAPTTCRQSRPAAVTRWRSSMPTMTRPHNQALPSTAAHSACGLVPQVIVVPSSATWQRSPQQRRSASRLSGSPATAHPTFRTSTTSGRCTRMDTTAAGKPS